jgi:hypothetical protein
MFVAERGGGGEGRELVERLWALWKGELSKQDEVK